MLNINKEQQMVFPLCLLVMCLVTRQEWITRVDLQNCSCVQQNVEGALLLNLWSPVVTIYTTSLTFNNSTFCPHSVFMCFVWISEQTAIISLYNINWLVCITDAVCLLRGMDWVTQVILSFTLLNSGISYFMPFLNNKILTLHLIIFHPCH